MNRFRLYLLALICPLAAALSLPALSGGQSLQTKIERKRAEIDQKRGRERVLTTTIADWSAKIDNLQGDIDTLQARQVRVETDLSAKRKELDRLQRLLRQERVRLVRLRKRLAEARASLGERLVANYKADEPDAVTVILESDGFAELLERAEFMQRVSEQDAGIIDRVRAARKEAVATEARLDRLETRQSEVTAIVARRFEEIVEVKDQLVARRVQYASVREERSATLASVRVSRKKLERHLVGLERESARVQARLASAQSPSSSGGPPAQPVKSSGGRFIWPANGTLTSPFGPRWGRLHAGMDVAVPEGTPLRAAGSGRVAIAGWTGGYGNYTCIDHGGGISTCMAHQSSISTSVGANVSKGQVVGRSGNTGNSTGPHLHFEVRSNGSPVDPSGYL